MTKCLLDTGADKCLFPKGIAQITGHNLDHADCDTSNGKGIEGSEIKTWIHSFKIELFTEDLSKRIWKSGIIKVGCIDHDKTPPILGFLDFFQFMNIRFNYVTKKIVIEI